MKFYVKASLVVLALDISALSLQAVAQTPRVPSYQGEKKLNVIAVCYFENFQGKGKTVSLEYVARVNIRDREALSREVDEIWREFRAEAERLRAKRVLINPNSSTTKGVSTAFVFELDGESRWARTPAPKSTQ